MAAVKYETYVFTFVSLLWTRPRGFLTIVIHYLVAVHLPFPVRTKYWKISDRQFYCCPFLRDCILLPQSLQTVRLYMVSNCRQKIVVTTHYYIIITLSLLWETPVKHCVFIFFNIRITKYKTFFNVLYTQRDELCVALYKVKHIDTKLYLMCLNVLKGIRIGGNFVVSFLSTVMIDVTLRSIFIIPNTNTNNTQ